MLRSASKGISILLAASFAACSRTVPPTVLPAASPSPLTTASITLTATVSPTPTPHPPDLPVVSGAELGFIDFQDASYGWAISVNGGGQVLRTVDGGSTWLNATPPEAGNIGLSSRLFVLDSDHAWVLVQGADFYQAKLFHTENGGVSWLSNDVPFGNAYMQFLDGTIGRALADRGAGAGSEAVGLYQSSDNGATWKSVFHNDPTEAGASQSLPLEGVKNGMTFLDMQNGWVSGNLPVQGEIYLYATHDGGVSWEKQSLSLPAGYKNYLYMAHAPIFFGQEGLLPLTVYLPDSTKMAFYRSADGGKSWTGDPGSQVVAGNYSFADAGHGWAWDGSYTLYRTSDGGLTWEQAATNLGLTGHLSQLEFTPTGDGSFTGWALTRLDESNHSELYRTTDNGITWTKVLP